MEMDWRIIVDEIVGIDRLAHIPREEINKLFVNSVKMELWCAQHVEKEISEEICSKFRELIEKTVDKLVRVRIVKELEGVEVSRGSFDDMLRDVVEKIIELYLKLLLRSVRTLDMKVLCRVKKGFQYRSSILTPGYITLISMDEAIRFALAGYVEPLMFA